MQTQLPYSQEHRKKLLRYRGCDIGNSLLDKSRYFGGMKGEDIKTFLESAGMAQAELARRIGMDATALNKVIKGIRQLKADEADKIRNVIDSRGQRVKIVDTHLMRDITEGEFTHGRAAAQTSRDLPVYGRGLPDDNGAVSMGKKPSEFIIRPTVLDSVGNGYALWVRDDTMEPRYQSGEVVYVHPDRPTPPNSWVVVKLRPNDHADGARVLIRRLVHISKNNVVVQQLNPEADMEIDRAQVLDIDRIVQSGER